MLQLHRQMGSYRKIRFSKVSWGGTGKKRSGRAGIGVTDEKSGGVLRRLSEAVLHMIRTSSLENIPVDRRHGMFGAIIRLFRGPVKICVGEFDRSHADIGADRPPAEVILAALPSWRGEPSDRVNEVGGVGWIRPAQSGRFLGPCLRGRIAQQQTTLADGEPRQCQAFATGWGYQLSEESGWLG